MHDLTTIPFGLWPATLKKVKEAHPFIILKHRHEWPWREGWTSEDNWEQVWITPRALVGISLVNPNRQLGSARHTEMHSSHVQ
jgi:hypothetical protein